MEYQDTKPKTSRDPIAIIGIGCRFPGATGTEEFWQVLREGRSTIRPYVPGRFPFVDSVYEGKSVLGRSATSLGGFLSDVDRFDTGFFEMSQREGALLDPQVRLLLETAWHAVEDAGVPREKLAGTRTGVFTGIWASDYEVALRDEANSLDFYSTTGTGRYSGSGRLSHFFDLSGPSVTVDTACSSSLVAVHLACRSLWSAECDMALAGGANVIARPEISLIYSRAGMLSPDGRIKFGDASANGYVRSEGAGMILLKPLSAALADGDSVYAVIRGSATNNDGRSAKRPLSPSLTAHSELLQRALADAGLTPDCLDYVEAHGTGTHVGDPIELEAIGRVLAKGRARRKPCRIGSVKTNIGHLESAAGIAGVIKVALALRHGLIPASLNFETPNPAVRWAELPIEIPSSPVEWQDQGTPRRAGVSGLGITGTNAHILLESAATSSGKERDGNRPSSPYLLCVSGHNETALEEQVGKLRQLLANSNPAVEDICYTSVQRRTHHLHRLCATAENRKDLDRKLAAWQSAESLPGVVSGRARPSNGKAVFVFSGAGGQWARMGCALMEREPVFRRSMEACAAAVYNQGGRDLLKEMNRVPEEWQLGDIASLQVMLWAIQVSLTDLWRSWGIHPAAVIGHSMGEVAAAVACGALTLEDSAAIICHRARLMARTAGRGAMAAAAVTPDEAERRVAGFNGRVVIGGINGPNSVIFSGDPDAIEALVSNLNAENIFSRRINVNLASHSAQMELIRSDFEAGLRKIQPKSAGLPFYSTVTGTNSAGIVDAAYWGRHLRQPVLFWPAVEAIVRDGFDTFIEIGPHPVLLPLIEQGTRHLDVITVASMQRESPEGTSIQACLSALHTKGFPVDLARCTAPGRTVSLPPFVWKGERCWLEAGAGPASARRGSLLGPRVESSVDPGTWLWTLEAANTGHVHLVEILAEAALTFASNPVSFRRITFHSVFEGELQLAILQRKKFQIAKRTAERWIVCCDGEICPLSTIESMISGGGPGSQETAFEGSPILSGAVERAERILKGSCSLTAIERLDLLPGLVAGRLTLSEVSDDAGTVISGEARSNAGLIASFQGVRFRRIDPAASLAHLYSQQWRPLTARCFSPVPSGQGDRKVRIIGQNPAAEKALANILARWNIAIAAKATEATEIICLCLKAADFVTALKGIGSRIRQIWVVTHRACAGDRDRPAGEPDHGDSIQLDQAPVTGLAAALRREHPEWRCCHVDIRGDRDLELLAGLVAENATEEIVSLRSGAVCGMRFEPVLEPIVPAQSSRTAFRKEATYLVTGGLGGVGMAVARYLTQSGAGHIVLTSRRQPSVDALEAIGVLRAHGADVKVIPADISDPVSVSRLLSTIQRELPPLRGVFHAATVREDLRFDDVTDSAIDRVFGPKVAGAWHLHCQTAELDHFVLFSSIAVTFTQPGQALYAAANSALDAIAAERRRLGLPGVSIQWSPWADTGMARAEGAQRSIENWSTHGILQLTPETAINMLDLALRSEGGCVMAARFDWDKLRDTWQPCPSSIADLAGAGDSGRSDAHETFRQRLRDAGAEERSAIAEKHVREHLALVLKMDPSRIDPRRPFGMLGLNSLVAVEFVSSLSRLFGLRLPVIDVFNYPTVTSFSAELTRRFLGDVSSALSSPAEMAGQETDLPTESEAILALIGAGEAAGE